MWPRSSWPACSSPAIPPSSIAWTKQPSVPSCGEPRFARKASSIAGDRVEQDLGERRARGPGARILDAFLEREETDVKRLLSGLIVLIALLAGSWYGRKLLRRVEAPIR